MADYSHKDFTGQDLSDCTDMNDQTIKCSCFSHEEPDSTVFPSDMKGVTFIGCNLDNCLIPAGNIIQDCSQRRYKVQDDGYDWIIDENNKPVERI